MGIDERVKRACNYEVDVHGERIAAVVLMALALRQSDALHAHIDNEDEVFIRAITVIRGMLEASS